MPPSISTFSSRRAAAASVAAPARQRVLLYSAIGPDAPKLVAAELARLEALYLKARKRKCSVDLLISSWGPHDRTIMGLTAAYTPEQEDDVAFLRTNASPSAPETATAATASAGNRHSSPTKPGRVAV